MNAAKIPSEAAKSRPPSKPSSKTGNSRFERSAFASALDALPEIAFVLAQDRRIVFANLAARSAFQGAELSDKRPGDILKCVNALASGGCGSSENCGGCQLAAAISESMADGAMKVRECAVISEDRELKLRVSASPARARKGKHLTVLSVADIAYRKSLLSIDAAFFGEMMNQASGIYGLSLTLAQASPEAKELIAAKIARRAKRLCDAVKEQHCLFAAEDGLAGLNIEELSSAKLLKELAWFHSSSENGSHRKVKVAPDSGQIGFESDKALIFKAMSKMIKSISSYPPADAEIQLSCRQLDNDRIEFSIFKPDETGKEALLEARGAPPSRAEALDLYCAKSIIERRLHGAAGFRTEENPGFFLRLNRKMPEPHALTSGSWQALGAS